MMHPDKRKHEDFERDQLDGDEDYDLDDDDDDASLASYSRAYEYKPRVKKTPVTIGLEPAQLEGLKKLVVKGGPLGGTYSDRNYADAIRTAVDDLLAKHAKPAAKKKPPAKKKAAKKKAAKKKPARKAPKKAAKKAAKKKLPKRSRR